MKVRVRVGKGMRMGKRMSLGMIRRRRTRLEINRINVLTRINKV